MYAKLLVCFFHFCVFHAVGGQLLGSSLLNRRITSPAKIGARQRVLNSHKRMPMYMIQLYKELTSKSGDGVSRKRMPYSANAIRGINSATKILSNSSMILYFNLGYFKDTTTITRDEIHLHMNPIDPLDRNIFKPYVLRFKDIHSNRVIRRYTVPAFNQGWQVLSLNKWTNRWVKDPRTNKGVLLTIRRGRNATRNPFINFPAGNGPYMILFASENVQSLMAWRFLIQNALNSVAGYPPRTRREIARDLSLRSQDGQRMTRDLSQQSQCVAVETDKNLTNTIVNGRFEIIHPTVYKMINCSSRCTMRPTRGYFRTSPASISPIKAAYCCMPAKHLDLMVLLKDPLSGDVEVQLIKEFVPTGCMWSRQ